MNGSLWAPDTETGTPWQHWALGA